MSPQDLIQSIRDDWLPPNAERLQKGFERSLKSLSDDLYTKDTHFVLEFIQNADDNTYLPDVTPTLRIRLQDDKLTISSNEIGFNAENVRAICSIGESTKAGKKEQGYIGEKGIGFKSSFKVSDVIHIASNEYRFKFDRRERLGMIVPSWDPDAPAVEGETTFTLDISGDTSASLAADLLKINPSLLLFMRRLRALHIDIETDSPPFSFSAKFSCNVEETHETGFSRVRIKREEVKAGQQRLFRSRYLILSESLSMADIQEPKRIGIDTSQLTLAFPIKKDGSPDISPQNVFAYLPLGSFGFKFVVQADFLTSSNRQDILEASTWNRRLRDQIAAVFCSAVDLFLGDEQLRFSWLLYITGEVSHPFFNVAMHSLISELKQKSILMDSSLIQKRVNAVLLLPSRFRRDDEPLVASNLLDGQSYLHEGYCVLGAELMHVLERRLALQTMQDSHLFNALWRMSRIRSFAGKSSEWHRVIASRLCEMYDHNPANLGHEIRRLWIIPLKGGTWTSTTWNEIYFPISGTSTLSPSHLEIHTVDSVAASVPERRRFYEKMGVREISVQTIASKILDAQNDLDVDDYISNARFFFVNRHADPPPNHADLYFAVEGGGALLGHETYLDDSKNGGRLRKALQALGSSCQFISPLYLSETQIDLPPSQLAQWRSWLTKTCKIRTAPDAYTDLPIMADKLPLAEFLGYLQYFWTRFPTKKPTWQSALAEASVSVHGRRIPLRDTCLRRSALVSKDYNDLPFLPVPEPSDSRWDFLATLGVSMHLNANLCLQLLVGFSSLDVTQVPFSRVLELYTQLDARFMDCPDIICEQFQDNKLLYRPADKHTGREAQWLGTDDDVFWDGPSSLVFHYHLEKIYPRTLRGFFDRIGVSSASSDAVLSELRRLSGQYSTQALDTSTLPKIFALLDDLFDLSAHETISYLSTRSLVEDVAMFPAAVSSGSETILRLYRLDQVYVSGRYTHFTDAFRTHVPILASPPTGARDMARFLNSSVCSGLVRKLDDLVVSACIPSDSGSPDVVLMAAIEEKYEELIRAVTKGGHSITSKPSPEQISFLSRLKAVDVRRVDRLAATLKLDHIEVSSNESVWIDDSIQTSSGPHLSVYIVRGTSIPDKAALQERFYAEVARRLSLQKQEIAKVMLTPVEILEKLRDYDDDDLPTMDEMQELSGRSSGNAYQWSSNTTRLSTRAARPRRSGVSSATPRAMPSTITEIAATTSSQVTQVQNEDLGGRLDRALSGVDLTSPISAEGLASRVHQSQARHGRNVPFLPATDTLRQDLSAGDASRAPSSAVQTALRAEIGDLSSQMERLVLSSPTYSAPRAASHEPALVDPTVEQQVNGILGERIFFEVLSNLLGRDAASESWTSELRGRSGAGLTEYSPTSSTLGDFTIAKPELSLQFSQYLFKARPEILEEYARSGEWPTFHIEIKSTSSEPNTPFVMSRRQFEIAKQLHVARLDEERARQPPKHIFVLVRVWDVRNSKPSLEKMALYADPFQCLLDGELILMSDRVEMALTDVPI
ncbi:hypothetical protein PENSPDRAFT_691796 [Peniophora sp. CONT]|nr:hypothetical protein PENSPDRAFT_691796 [Peniophora sp. CONT]